MTKKSKSPKKIEREIKRLIKELEKYDGMEYSRKNVCLSPTPRKKKKRKSEKKNLQGFINYYCPNCKNKQAIPEKTVHDFNKGRHSHPGGTTAFVCTKCGSPMKPMEKEDV